MSTTLYRRSPRRPPPQMPKGELVLESPPELPEEEAAGGAMQKWLSVLPMAGGAVSMVFMATMFSGGDAGGGSGRMTMRMVAMGLMGVSTMGMGLSQLANRGGDRKKQVDSGRRDYLRYLTQLRRRVRSAADKQREALEFRYPDPDQLWALPLSRRLWERRPTDKDFGHVRVARGAQGFLLNLVPPQTKPVEDLDPVASAALRRFRETYRRVNDLPVALSLRAFAHFRMEGDVETIRDATRAMLAHLATFHAPHELILAFCIGPDRRAEWDWVKWLPHTLHPAATDGAGHLRYVAGSLSELERLLADQLAGRPPFSPEGGPLTDAPHIIVVVDGGHAGADSMFVSSPPHGSTLIDVTGQAARQGGQGVLRLEINRDQVNHLTRNRDEWRSSPLGRPDRLSVTEIEALARTLAPLRATTKSGQTTSATDAEVEEDKPQFENDLMQLLGVNDAYTLDLEELWKPRPRETRLRIPFGLDDKGMPIELDIKESAQGGMGPHGLVIGATGSGKSEVLRTIVLGLVATHSPDYLNLVLVDFKGGATFFGLNQLPHTSAVITNLEGELTLVDRMQDAIAGEMARRQELLREAGNYGSLRDYEEDRAKGKPLEPMPTLWIVADEFSELLTAKPEFINVFLQIGRIGRSIGVHLLLASQRLEEGKLKGLDTFLSYRFGLRTFSAGESRVVLGVPDAYELPRKPGGGYLKVGTDSMTRFQAAYVGAPYERPTVAGAGSGKKKPAKPGEKRFVPQITAYTTDYVEPNIIEIPPEPEPEVEAPAAGPAGPAPGEPKVLIDLVVEQLVGKGRPAHQVWLPPLEQPPTLDGLLPPLKVSEELGLQADWEGRGSMTAPVSLVDKPYHQRRDPMWLDLSGAGGHVGIGGSPQSGKSTAVRSLITSLALTHTPEEVGFYCLDFGGGTLPALMGLPHMGGVATRLDADGIRRTIGEMTALLTQREITFTENGIDSIGTYRRLRKQGRIGPDRFPTDVFLVIDGWGTVRGEHEAVEKAATTLAARGLGFGIHVVATCVKWNEFRIAIKDLFQTKLELRLGDPHDSEIDRKMAANVPNNRSGRGLSPERLHFLGALPRIDGIEDDDDLADGVKAMVDAVAGAWKGPRAAPVRLLPERLPVETLPQPGPDLRRALLPIGIDEDELKPVFLNLEEEPHLFVTGSKECGKSNLLEVIAKGIVSRYTPREAKVVIVDYRRSLLETLTGSEHLLGYAPSSDAAKSLMKDIAGALQARVPGPNVTPEQLKNRNWWSGSDLYIIVDDYDLVATSSGNPLSPLADMVSQARDIGLHLIISRGFGGVGRAMFDPILQRARDMGNPALIMSGTKDEGAIWGLKAQPLVVGRGTLISRRLGNKLMQTAWVPRPDEEN